MSSHVMSSLVKSSQNLCLRLYTTLCVLVYFEPSLKTPVSDKWKMFKKRIVYMFVYNSTVNITLSGGIIEHNLDRKIFWQGKYYDKENILELINLMMARCSRQIFDYKCDHYHSVFTSQDEVLTTFLLGTAFVTEESSAAWWWGYRCWC